MLVLLSIWTFNYTITLQFVLFLGLNSLFFLDNEVFHVETYAIPAQS